MPIDENASKASYFAQRTGPVTATMTGIARQGNPQYFRCKVVFDAARLNRLDCKNEEGYACDKEGYYTHLYPVYKIVDSPQYYLFTLDGVSPGKDGIDHLRR